MSFKTVLKNLKSERKKKYVDAFGVDVFFKNPSASDMKLIRKKSESSSESKDDEIDLMVFVLMLLCENEEGQAFFEESDKDQMMNEVDFKILEDLFTFSLGKENEEEKKL